MRRAWLWATIRAAARGGAGAGLALEAADALGLRAAGCRAAAAFVGAAVTRALGT